MEETFESGGIEDTWALARDFASRLQGGEVVALHGGLGAGKTTFVQGLAAALGAKHAVTSPTFCLVAEHPSERFLLVHMDLYRLQRPDDVLDLGWEDYLASGAVLLVEWPGRAGDLIPPGAWHVSFSQGAAEDSRTISIRKGGAA